MSRLVATVNGQSVISDKVLVSIVGSVVTFIDGSWCNVDTGEVVNNGYGVISIGKPAGQTGKITVGPTRYNTRALEVRGVQADLVIIVHDVPFCEFTMTGPQGQLEAIEVNERGGILVIEGESSGGSGVTIISGGGSSIRAGRISTRSMIIGDGGVSFQGGNITIGGGSSGQNEVKITVKVPKGTAVDLTDVDGRINIGDTEGALRLSMGGVSNICVGRIGKLRARLSGSSNMEIRHVIGDVNIDVSGSGSIIIHGGLASQLDINLSGMGTVRFDGSAQDADLSVSGMGRIDVAWVTNCPRRSKSGMASITVDNWPS